MTIQELHDAMMGRFGKLETRMSKLETRMSKLETAVNENTKTLHRHTTEISKFNTAIKGIFNIQNLQIDPSIPPIATPQK